MKIRGVDLEHYVGLFSQMRGDLDPSPVVMEKVYRCRYERNFVVGGVSMVRSLSCDEWSVHLETLEQNHNDVRRLVFSGDEDKFMSDMIMLKLHFA